MGHRRFFAIRAEWTPDLRPASAVIRPLVGLICLTLAGILSQTAMALELPGPGGVPAFLLSACTPDGQTDGALPSEATPHVSVSTAPPDAADPDRMAGEVVRLINLARREAGLLPYALNQSLTTIAGQHSAYMRDHDCFAHQCPGQLPPPERACNAGYHPYGSAGCYVGETIAAGYPDPASAVAGWLERPTHRAILLDDRLREIGVGFVAGGTYGTYWTVDYGSQPDVLPVFINDNEPETSSRQVVLALTNETVSGWCGIDYAPEVMISSQPGFEGSTWELYERHKQYTLPPGEGPKRVYVKYRDATGDEVISVDDIRLDEPSLYDLQVSTNALAFVYEIGSGFVGPTASHISIVNAATGGSMDWEAQGSWTICHPMQGRTPGELTISVEGFGPATAGTYQDTLLVTSPQTPDQHERIIVTVQVVNRTYEVMLPLVIAPVN